MNAPTPKRRRAARLRPYLPELSAIWIGSTTTVLPLMRNALREVLR